jgi:hypothetical protein
LEHLSDTSFLGKLLVFLANVRLDEKVIASYKHSSLFCLVVSDKRKKFYNNDTRVTMLALKSQLDVLLTISMMVLTYLMLSLLVMMWKVMGTVL